MPSALAVLAILVALGMGYVWGRRTRRTDGSIPPSPPPSAPADALPTPSAPVAQTLEPGDSGTADLDFERARLVRSYEAECARVQRALRTAEAHIAGLGSLAGERPGLIRELDAAKRETARYRQLVIDIENSAPPPLLGGPGMPDDLKLIVGVGPVLERMLHQLGITTFRQIALWTERDIEDIDAHLSEFRGRIRRDGWVTQARALHQSTYGAPPSARERG